jgi:hypothetical protein
MKLAALVLALAACSSAASETVPAPTPPPAPAKPATVPAAPAPAAVVDEDAPAPPDPQLLEALAKLGVPAVAATEYAPRPEWLDEHEGCVPQRTRAMEEWTAAYVKLCTKAMKRVGGCVRDRAFYAAIPEGNLDWMERSDLVGLVRTPAKQADLCEQLATFPFCTGHGLYFHGMLAAADLVALATATDCRATGRAFPRFPHPGEP